MAPPLYFFPKLTLDQLAPGGRLDYQVLAGYGVGLERTFADVELVPRDAAAFDLAKAGPGGHSGSLLCALAPSGPPPVRVGYFPDFQEWEETLGGVWVAADREHPITAEDVSRRRRIGGYQVELAGQTWEIPVIRDPQGGSQLPSSYVYGKDRKATKQLKAQYVDLWLSLAKACWLFFDPEGPYPELSMELTEATNLCLDCLSVNYRVGMIEQNLLGLVDSETWTSILACAVDYLTYRDLARQVDEQKKTRYEARLAELRAAAAETSPPESPDISPGPAASGPGTGQVGESSSLQPSA